MKTLIVKIFQAVLWKVLWADPQAMLRWSWCVLLVTSDNSNKYLMLGVSHLFWALYIQFTPLIFATNSTMKLPIRFFLFFKIHPETDAQRVACPGGQNWCLNWGLLASESLFPKTVMYLWWRWLYSQDLGLTAIPFPASFLLPLCCLPVPSSLRVSV